MRRAGSAAAAAWRAAAQARSFTLQLALRGLRASAPVARSHGRPSRRPSARAGARVGSVSQLPKRPGRRPASWRCDRRRSLNFKDAMILLGQTTWSGSRTASRLRLSEPSRARATRCGRATASCSRATRRASSSTAATASARRCAPVARRVAAAVSALAQAMAVGTAGITAAHSRTSRADPTRCGRRIDDSSPARRAAASASTKRTIPMLRRTRLEYRVDGAQGDARRAPARSCSAPSRHRPIGPGLLRWPSCEGEHPSSTPSAARPRGGARADKVPRRPRVGRRRRRRADYFKVYPLILRGVRLLGVDQTHDVPDVDGYPCGSCALGGVAKGEARDVGVLRGCTCRPTRSR